MDTPTLCADHCRRWLAASGLDYGRSSREAFARAHPALFGSAYEVALRGYERWLERTNTLDDLDTFADYLAARFERALAPRRELFAYEGGAHPIDVQQVIESALVGEHRVSGAVLSWQPQHR
jgi:hypothetical protein